MVYSLCAQALRLICPSPSRAARVSRILEGLFSLTPLTGCGPVGGMELLIDDAPEGEVSGELVFDAPGLSAIRTEQGYRLRSGASFLVLDLRSGRAHGSLSATFIEAPPEDQRGLFLFAFLLLLSARGFYPMHAAGVAWQGCGFLLAGCSGSGKTTLTCALTRSGWQYLSDDSVLLRQGASSLEALAFGRPFHCTSSLFHHFPELAAVAGRPAHGKHLVDVGPVYPGLSRSTVRPGVVLFPEIANAPLSRLIPLNSSATLLRLVGEGAGFLHNRDFMTAQLALLGDLARTARGFRLLHGTDVYTDPSRVSALLQQVGKHAGNAGIPGEPRPLFP